MKTDSIVRLYSRDEIHSFIEGVWKTDLFRNLHKDGYNDFRLNLDLGKHNFVSKIVDDYANLPRFVFKMSDSHKEWAHFSTWWGGIPFRTYDNPYIHDLYWIHEMAHAGNMVYVPGMNLPNFERKMTDNELHASVVSEIQVYLEIPELRALSFNHPIYADRFLNNNALRFRYAQNKALTFEEIKTIRRNTMIEPNAQDISDRWIHRFYMQNAAWVAVWSHSYDKVEAAMAKLRDDSMLSGRKAALDNYLFNNIYKDFEFDLSGGSIIPYEREADAFAGVYWANRGHYDDAMKLIKAE